MTPAYAKIVLASRGLTPARIAEGCLATKGLPGSSERYQSCARNARAYVASYSQSLERVSRENSGAVPCNSRELVEVIAALEQEARAWEALALASNR